MSLTVKEKEHWKYRIERRIDRRIKEIQASEPAQVWSDMDRQARQMAWDKLGIAAQAQELERLEKLREQLKRDEQRLWRTTVAMLRGVDLSDVKDDWSVQSEVEREIAKHKELILEQLQAAHPKGQQIQQLQQEKDELLDTVWLATSTSQIKELWSQIAEGLQSTVTPFQKKAIAIEPFPATSSHE